MIHQNIELIVWIGLAVLALVGADIGLWHARRVLSQIRPDTSVRVIRVVPPVVGTSAHADSASSVLAS